VKSKSKKNRKADAVYEGSDSSFGDDTTDSSEGEEEEEEEESDGSKYSVQKKHKVCACACVDVYVNEYLLVVRVWVCANVATNQRTKREKSIKPPINQLTRMHS
jgi:hypothetical protein